MTGIVAAVSSGTGHEFALATLGLCLIHLRSMKPVPKANPYQWVLKTDRIFRTQRNTSKP